MFFFFVYFLKWSSVRSNTINHLVCLHLSRFYLLSSLLVCHFEQHTNPCNTCRNGPQMHRSKSSNPCKFIPDSDQRLGFLTCVRHLTIGSNVLDKASLKIKIGLVRIMDQQENNRKNREQDLLVLGVFLHSWLSASHHMLSVKLFWAVISTVRIQTCIRESLHIEAYQIVQMPLELSLPAKKS